MVEHLFAGGYLEGNQKETIAHLRGSPILSSGQQILIWVVNRGSRLVLDNAPASPEGGSAFLGIAVRKIRKQKVSAMCKKAGSFVAMLGAITTFWKCSP